MASTWTYHDPALSVHLARGMTRAASGDWSTGSLAQREDDFRALVVATAYQMAKLTGSATETTSQGGEVAIQIDPAPTRAAPYARRAAAWQLYRTLAVLQGTTTTTDPGEMMAGGEDAADAGGLSLAAVVAISVAGAAAVAYCAHEAGKVIDRQLSRQESTRRMMKAHAAALGVIELHTEREAAAGRQLPLDDASRQVLDRLGAAQNTAAQDLGPYGDFVPKSIAAGAGSGLSYLPWIAGGAVLAAIALARL